MWEARHTNLIFVANRILYKVATPQDAKMAVSNNRAFVHTYFKSTYRATPSNCVADPAPPEHIVVSWPCSYQPANATPPSNPLDWVYVS